MAIDMTTIAMASRSLRRSAAVFARLLEEELGDNLVAVVLFGSVARGEATANSDIDLLVVCETLPAGRFARLGELERVDARFEDERHRLLAEGIDTRVVPILKTRQEALRVVPLYLDMVEDGCLLVDRGGFFAEVLAGLRERLRALGAERRRRGQVRYWVLKPDFRPGESIEL
jgi:predicted nucleotidyltransferase